MYMYYDNSHLIENSHLTFLINDYKAHLSSLPSQFDKLISIGLNTVFASKLQYLARITLLQLLNLMSDWLKKFRKRDAQLLVKLNSKQNNSYLETMLFQLLFSTIK